MGHFIKHLAASEPRTHRGGGKAAVHALLKALVVLRRGAVDGMGSAPAWGGARASTSKKRSVGLGTVVRGAVDGCSGMGRCTGLGVEEEEHGARNGGAGGDGRVLRRGAVHGRRRQRRRARG